MNFVDTRETKIVNFPLQCLVGTSTSNLVNFVKLIIAKILLKGQCVGIEAVQLPIISLVVK